MHCYPNISGLNCKYETFAVDIHYFGGQSPPYLLFVILTLIRHFQTHAGDGVQEFFVEGFVDGFAQ